MASQKAANPNGGSGGGAGGKRPYFQPCPRCSNPHNPQMACWAPCLACNGRRHHPRFCPRACRIVGYQGYLQEQPQQQGLGSPSRTPIVYIRNNRGHITIGGAHHTGEMTPRGRDNRGRGRNRGGQGRASGGGAGTEGAPIQPNRVVQEPNPEAPTRSTTGAGAAPVWRLDTITLDQQVEAMIANAGPIPAGVDPEEDHVALDIAARTFWTMPGSIRAFESVAARLNRSLVRAVLAWQSGEVVLTSEEYAIIESAQPLV